MNRVTLCLLFFFAVTSSAYGTTESGHARTPVIPETITVRNATLPIWVDARVALRADGSVNEALFGEYAHQLQQLLTAPDEGDCHKLAEVYVEHAFPPARPTLETAVKNSPTAMLARVTGKAFGFYAGVPGQLLQLRTIRAYGARTGLYYYYFVPVGAFSFGDFRICKTDAEYAQPPDVGDDAFLFVHAPQDAAQELLTAYGAEDLIPVKDDKLILPRNFRRSSSATQRSDKASLLNMMERTHGTRNRSAQ